MSRNAMRALNDERLLALVSEIDPLPSPGGDMSSDGAALLERVLTTPRSLRSRRRWFERPRLVAVAAVVAAIVAASSAFGAVALVRLLNGQPAPPAVTQELHGGSAAGEVQLTTSSGDVANLYAAQMNGHDCAYLRVVPASAAEFGEAGHRGAAVCVTPASEDAAFSFATDGAMLAGKNSFEFVYGKVSAAVASVSLRDAAGQETTLPLSQGYFLHEVTSSDGANGLVLIARDASAQQLQQELLAPITTGPGQG